MTPLNDRESRRNEAVRLANLAPDDAAAARRVRGLARLLDTAITVPGTGIRFGLDALIGLVPGLGDVAGAAASGYVILSAARLGAPRSVLARMLVNVALDALVGTVPLLGDLFDVGFKANMRNADLLEAHLARPGDTRAASRSVVGLVLLGVLLLAAAGVAVTVLLLRALAALAT